MSDKEIAKIRMGGGGSAKGGRDANSGEWDKDRMPWKSGEWF